MCSSDLKILGISLPENEDDETKERAASLGVCTASKKVREIALHEKIVYSMNFADSKGNKVEPAQYGIEHEAIDGEARLFRVSISQNIPTPRLHHFGHNSRRERLRSG